MRAAKTGFITNVSILKEYSGERRSVDLAADVLGTCTRPGFNRIKLEVSRGKQRCYQAVFTGWLHGYGGKRREPADGARDLRTIRSVSEKNAGA